MINKQLNKTYQNIEVNYITKSFKLLKINTRYKVGDCVLLNLHENDTYISHKLAVVNRLFFLTNKSTTIEA